MIQKKKPRNTPKCSYWMVRLCIFYFFLEILFARFFQINILKKAFKGINNIKISELVYITSTKQLNKCKESVFLDSRKSKDRKLSWDCTSLQFLSRKCYSTQKNHSTLFWKKGIAVHGEPDRIIEFLELRVFKEY